MADKEVKWPFYPPPPYEHKHDWPQDLEPHYNTFFDVGDWWTSEGGEWKVVKDKSTPRIYKYDSGWHDSYMDRDSRYESEESRYYNGEFHEPIISTYIPEAVRKVTYDVQFYRWDLSDKVLDQMDLDMLMNMLRYLYSKKASDESTIGNLIVILEAYLHKRYKMTIN